MTKDARAAEVYRPTARSIEDRFRFKTEFGIPDSFLYNVGPITSLDDPD